MAEDPPMDTQLVLNQAEPSPGGEATCSNVLTNSMGPPAAAHVVTSALTTVAQNRNQRTFNLKKKRGDEDYQVSESESENAESDNSQSKKPRMGGTATTTTSTTKERVTRLEAHNKKLANNVAYLLKTVQAMQTQIDTQKDVTSELKGMFKELTDSPIFESNLKVASANIHNAQQTRLNANEVNLLTAVTIEKNDSYSREKNILIMAVPDVPTSRTNDAADHNKEMVNNILGVIGVQAEWDSIYRFKTTPNSKFPGIIKLAMKTKVSRNEMLKASVKLRKYTGADNAGLSKVFINPDLTLAQRIRKKELITKRNALNEARKVSDNPVDKTFYYGIRNFQLTKIKIK
jgi:hypothetical protein